MGLEILVMYVAVGLIAGLLAGLLGIGGGVVIVPLLAWCFLRQGIQPDHIMHLALGTSLASIIFTSISSFLSHHRRGAVDWTIVRRIVPGILVGTFLGTMVASQLSSNFLKGFFCLFLYTIATQIILNKKPKASRQLPGNAGMFATGSTIGAVSSFVGIGGGSLSVPFMLWCNVTAHRAIGTSAAIGLPIAVAGAIGYIVNNLQVTGLPAYSIGYVYLPALAGIVCASVLTAPLGARLAHSLPVDRLKRFFAIFLYVVATRMAWELVA
ncbi:sulfite exporter TauE/SafE family protein [Desulfurispirillum indicum]|uniref:sulfite exporter TauE/SafE family protein n=1 Tax=Desulfurispirillum indicum TaxID=936456 RepID=UPI001CFA4D5B|nr:sulfite exporter TauE/SafE family protein [Desulfurispirillum indicum]UCZ56192.1 sulfite exporter TauE/SafE family protein [Desulfurispirillum indicum]